ELGWSLPVCPWLCGSGRGLGDAYTGAVGLERGVDGLDDPDDVQADLGARARLLARANRRAEVAQLEEERLGGRHVRGDNVSCPIRELVLAEGLRIRQVDAAVEDPHGLVARVVV